MKKIRPLFVLWQDNCISNNNKILHLKTSNK